MQQAPRNLSVAKGKVLELLTGAGLGDEGVGAESTHSAFEKT